MGALWDSMGILWKPGLFRSPPDPFLPSPCWPLPSWCQPARYTWAEYRKACFSSWPKTRHLKPLAQALPRVYRHSACGCSPAACHGWCRLWGDRAGLAQPDEHGERPRLFPAASFQVSGILQTALMFCQGPCHRIVSPARPQDNPGRALSGKPHKAIRTVPCSACSYCLQLTRTASTHR